MHNYKQYDYNATYSGGTFASQACGPTSCADIVDVSPIQTADWLTEHGYAVTGHGTDWGGIAPCLSAFNGGGRQLNAGNLYGQSGTAAEKTWKESAIDGYCGILLMGGPSMWTGSGHFIACVGYKNGKFLIYDPASTARDGYHPWSDFDGLVKVFYTSSVKWGGGGSSTKHSFSFKQVELGSTGNSVLLVQEILKARNIYKGELDKSAGPKTIEAITNYQKMRSQYLAVDGKCGIKTFYDLTALEHIGSVFTVNQCGDGDTGYNVLLAQEILKARGIYNGQLDSYYGAKTKAAVMEYQKMRHAQAHLNVDGICGPATFTDLLGM